LAYTNVLRIFQKIEYVRYASSSLGTDNIARLFTAWTDGVTVTAGLPVMEALFLPSVQVRFRPQSVNGQFPTVPFSKCSQPSQWNRRRYRRQGSVMTSSTNRKMVLSLVLLHG